MLHDKDGMIIDTEDKHADEMRTPQREMPRYKSHKEVWALKIKSIVNNSHPEQEDDGTRVVVPEHLGYAPFTVSHQYMHKHKPEPGGYYIRYKDGYESYSPAEAFEEGYTLIK